MVGAERNPSPRAHLERKSVSGRKTNRKYPSIFVQHYSGVIIKGGGDMDMDRRSLTLIGWAAGLVIFIFLNNLSPSYGYPPGSFPMFARYLVLLCVLLIWYAIMGINIVKEWDRRPVLVSAST